jgi:hypothetical protein
VAGPLAGFLYGAAYVRIAVYSGALRAKSQNAVENNDGDTKVIERFEVWFWNAELD